jgi:hypothetical protein
MKLTDPDPIASTPGSFTFRVSDDLTWTINPADAVTAGVLVLDRVKPDWRNAVDRERLDLRNWDTCVAAQVFGGYYQGIAVLREAERETGDVDVWEIAHGFMGPRSSRHGARR